MSTFRQEMAAIAEARHRAHMTRLPGDGLVEEEEQDDHGRFTGRKTGRRVPPPPAREERFLPSEYHPKQHVHDDECLVAMEAVPYSTPSGTAQLNQAGWSRCTRLAGIGIGPDGLLVHDHNGHLVAHNPRDPFCPVPL